MKNISGLLPRQTQQHKPFHLPYAEGKGDTYFRNIQMSLVKVSLHRGVALRRTPFVGQSSHELYLQNGDFLFWMLSAQHSAWHSSLCCPARSLSLLKTTLLPLLVKMLSILFRKTKISLVSELSNYCKTEPGEMTMKSWRLVSTCKHL